MPAKDRARIIAPPPLLAIICIAIAFWARHFESLPLFAARSAVQVVIGAGFIVAAIAIIVSCRNVFIRHGTHPNPYTPTKAVVVTGPYRFSRNPIYVAFLIFVLSFALLANSYWFVFAAVLLLILLHFGVVRREEIYLSEKFGDEYSAYCSRVRRWI
jgi:protein-S-isoprenylcysteine O-methyltransferase Ste14